MRTTDMETAIAGAVSDGDCVYLAGFTHLSPFAAGHEIIRQGATDLTIGRMSPDLIYDQLIGAGAASKFIFSFAPRGLRRIVEEGRPDGEPVEIEEYTHYGLAARLAAGARGLPFMPLRTFAGTDLPEHTDAIRRVESPYGDGEIDVVPPLRPDVTLIHVPRADENGNAQIWGTVGETRDAAFAADTVVLSAEELVPEDVIRSDPNRTVIPGTAVDYLVREPWGAHPAFVHGHYDRDETFYEDWDAIASSPERLSAWLDEWVYGVSDRREYVEKLGAGRLLDLKPDTNYATPIDMGGFQ